MKSDVRAIPVAPRRIRLRPLFAHRWPLLLAGAPLVVLGTLLAWAMFLQSGGKFSLGPSLDAGPTRRIRGTVVEVLPPRPVDGKLCEDVRYTFVWPLPGQPLGTELRGGCFVPAGTVHVGSAVDVEVLEATPNVNRVVGGLLHIDRDWLRASFWARTMVLPGALLLLGWLAGAFQLRRVLVHGDVSVGTVHRVRKVPCLLPEMLAVEATFRDHRAVTRHLRQWVRARGRLGQRLATSGADGYEPLPVLFDRQVPQWSRILVVDDFLPARPGDRTTPTPWIPS